MSLPPSKTTFCGNNSDGKNIKEMNIIPEKKNIENKIFLNIFLN